MGMDEPYIGEVAIFAGDFAPVGWFPCDGRLLPIAQYQPLYTIVGTNYGGDGITNFALPDLRGRSVLGMGNGPGLTPRPIAQKGGLDKVTLQQQELPAHNHPARSVVSGSGQLNCVKESGDSSDPSGAYIAAHPNKAFTKTMPSTTMNSDSVSFDTSALAIATTLENTGGNAGHENTHPVLGVNYIIAYTGIFPPRS